MFSRMKLSFRPGYKLKLVYKIFKSNLPKVEEASVFITTFVLVVTSAIEDKLSVAMLGNTFEAKPEVEMELVLSAFDCGAKIPMTTTKIVHICPIKIFSSFKNCDITFDFSLASSRLAVKRFVHLEINPGRCIALKVFSRPPYYHNTMATKQKTRDLSFA